MKFVVSPEDFLKGGLVEKGWHPALIQKWDDTKRAGQNAKNPGSTLIEVQYKITAGPNKGAVVYVNFSEVAPAFIVPLLEAIKGETFNKKENVEFDVNSATMEGKLVDIHVERGSYNNKPNNQVDGYRPYSGPVITA